MDLAAGIGWRAPECSIDGELKGCTLPTHTEEDCPQGRLALSFSWELNPSNAYGFPAYSDRPTFTPALALALPQPAEDLWPSLVDGTLR